MVVPSIISSSDRRWPSGSRLPEFASTSNVRKSPPFLRENFSTPPMLSSSLLFSSIRFFAKRAMSLRALANRRDCSSGYDSMPATGQVSSRTQRVTRRRLTKMRRMGKKKRSIGKMDMRDTDCETSRNASQSSFDFSSTLSVPKLYENAGGVKRS